MGSGKTTIGKLLAEKLRMDFIDFDKHIEQEAGKKISEIFDTAGENKFRYLEHEYLKKLLNKDNVVISLGGGTPCFYNNIELINKHGISVYIQMSVDVLVKRLSNEKKNRPLIRDLNEVDLRYFIETNLEIRLPEYQKANHTIQAENKPADVLIKDITKLIKKEK